MKILGISAYYHDSAASLVIDGKIVAAAQEERFSREKNDARFPTSAIRYCLKEAGITMGDIDYVSYYEKPLLKFERLLETYIAFAPKGFSSFVAAMPDWLKNKLYIERTIKKELGVMDGSTFKGKVLFVEHHESHAASAFYASPYQKAAIITMDGVGEFTTTSLGLGDGNTMDLLKEIHFPHSLGLLYSAITYYLGFKVNSGEYKVMGLAPYGEPMYVKLFKDTLIDIKEDGSYRLNMEYFGYCTSLVMTNKKFDALFGGPPRKSDTLLTKREMDIAASLQAITEEIVLKTARHVRKITGAEYLCLAGGVALNCVANGKIIKEKIFKDVWIQPASGDAGGAVGAALSVWYRYLNNPRELTGTDAMKAAYLGVEFSNESIEAYLKSKKIPFVKFSDEDLIDTVTKSIIAGDIIGWFQGRMEFGPRSLGNRSIIGDARNPTMQSAMNLKIKFRENFRPFAPCVLREYAHEWFDMPHGEDSPYMLLVAPVLPKHRHKISEKSRERLRENGDLLEWVNTSRSDIPAVTHVDYSARVQTIDERHGRFRHLLQRFYEKTGCPVLVNTSFNLSTEPIVCSPEEAYHTFMQSEMDVLVLGNFMLRKIDQPLGFKAFSKVGETSLDTRSPWADPKTGEPLIMTSQVAYNSLNNTMYEVAEGIPRLFQPTNDDELKERDVTDIVKQFYEKTPFPNYDNVDNARALLEKASQGLFARLLNEQIPYDARVVEIGCGTGQLTNFLAIGHRSVLGTDICLNSLRLAQKFKSEQGLDRATFAQMNLFRPALKDGFFDFVISNGVLHHTGDPKGAFSRIARLAKPGGYILVGLYNRYSRSIHYARRSLYRFTGLWGGWLDPHFRHMKAEGKRMAWFQDQYSHPHESSHTLDEVLGWLKENGLEFVNAIPKAAGGQILSSDERLFEQKSPGTRLSRILSQIGDLGSGYREGGLFIVIARRTQ